MTFKAIQSFQQTTPNVKVGLLIPGSFGSSDTLQRFLERLPDPNRVETRIFQTHFSDWNPTQYKLDLVKFADRYETVVWLDSDVLVYKDMSNFLIKFHTSPKNFAFTQDHVTSSDEFRRRWPESDRFLFIPQAAFMCFKAAAMAEFFAVWEDIWREWITPYPFFKYADPYPSFSASAFCIEQYALGMTVDRLLSNNFDREVYVIPRSEILITDTSRSLSSLFMPAHLQTADSASTSVRPITLSLGNTSSSSFHILLSSAGLLSSYGSLTSYNLRELSSAGLLSSSGILSSLGLLSSSGILSSMGLLTSYPGWSSMNIPTSYGALTSYAGVSSYGALSSFELGILSSLGLLSSYGLSSLNLSSYGLSSLSSLSTRADLLSSLVSAGAISSLQFVGSSSSSGEFSSLSSLFSNLVIVDNFGDNVIHYYSANYSRIPI
jgi:hypothetical protein